MGHKTGNPGDQAARLEAATYAARETLQEIHGVMKDMNAAIASARALLSTDIHAQMEEFMGIEFGIFRDAMTQARNTATDRTIAEFDRLGAILLAVDKRHANTLEELVEAVARKPHSGLVQKLDTTIFPPQG